MSNRICSISGCGRKHLARGWCVLHYGRWERYGDPEAQPECRRYEPGTTCSVEGCDNLRRERDWCNKHYLRWRTHGTVDLATQTDEERFLAKVDRRSDDECWPFEHTGSQKRGGYGVFVTEDGRHARAHVWAYEHFVKPVPPGYHVDHVRANGCVRRDCVNWVRHLEAVTPRENTLRGAGTKLSDELALSLYERHLRGEPQTVLGREIGIHSSSISRRFQRLRAEGLVA